MHKALTKYAQVALNASQQAALGVHPAAAWEAEAAKAFAGKPSAETKNCPKSAFLALAEIGFLTNVKQGKYTKSVDNKRYAQAALTLLQADSSWAAKPKELWSKVAEGSGTKRHNGQMDVVIALWATKGMNLEAPG